MDDSGMEADGYNETICPIDMYPFSTALYIVTLYSQLSRALMFQFFGRRQIVDDELWSNLVYPLPSGVRLTVLVLIRPGYADIL